MANFTTDTSNTTKVSQGIIVFHAGLNIFLSITASVGNTLILIALQNVSSLHPPTKLLFRCLAVTDLLVGLLLHPIHVIGLILDYRLNITEHYVDDITFLSSFVFCGISILISTAISVDRLLALFLGLRYRQIVTLQRIRTAIFGFLLVGVSTGLVYFFWSYIFSLIVTLVFIAFAVIISTVSYLNIFLRLRQHQSQVQQNACEGQANGGGTPLNIVRYKKTVSSIIWVQLALVACYAPFGISVIVIKINGWTGINAGIVWTFAGTLVFLNSSLNPFLYCWKLREVRQSVKATITRHLCC